MVFWFHVSMVASLFFVCVCVCVCGALAVMPRQSASTCCGNAIFQSQAIRGERLTVPMPRCSRSSTRSGRRQVQLPGRVEKILRPPALPQRPYSHFPSFSLCTFCLGHRGGKQKVLTLILPMYSGSEYWPCLASSSTNPAIV